MDHIDIDVHKKERQLCILSEDGERLESRVRTTAARFADVLGILSFVKTLSGSFRTIRIRGRQPRAEPERGRPASSHHRPCTESSDSR